MGVVPPRCGFGLPKRVPAQQGFCCGVRYVEERRPRRPLERTHELRFAGDHTHTLTRRLGMGVLGGKGTPVSIGNRGLCKGERMRGEGESPSEVRTCAGLFGEHAGDRARVQNDEQEARSEPLSDAVHIKVSGRGLARLFCFLSLV